MIRLVNRDCLRTCPNVVRAAVLEHVAAVPSGVDTGMPFDAVLESNGPHVHVSLPEDKPGMVPDGRYVPASIAEIYFNGGELRLLTSYFFGLPRGVELAHPDALDAITELLRGWFIAFSDWYRWRHKLPDGPDTAGPVASGVSHPGDHPR